MFLITATCNIVILKEIKKSCSTKGVAGGKVKNDILVDDCFCSCVMLVLCFVCDLNEYPCTKECKVVFAALFVCCFSICIPMHTPGNTIQQI